MDVTKSSAPQQAGHDRATTPLPEKLLNELLLLVYSAKMLVGRNLLAMVLISAGLVLTILTYQVGPFETREGLLLFQMEMFAPLLGIVMFSDLVAMEFEARRADLLAVSARGAAWLVIRKLTHAVMFTAIACLIVLVILRVTYTRFDFLPVCGTVAPGTLFFGMVGLLAASVARRGLVGYTVGAGALVLSLTLSQVEPLSPISYHIRAHLTNSQLFGEYNWLLAKIVFLGLAVLLAVAVLRLLAKPASWRSVVVGSLIVVIATHAGLHWLWSAPRGQIAAATLVKEEGGQNVFLWESRARVESVPLFIGKFREYHSRYRDIPLSFCAFTVEADYAERVLQLAADALRDFEAAFGL